MTKQEVRSVALSKLAPSADAVVYDIGAGTGSCTVELALQAPFGKVYAFEINGDALHILQQNIAHFDLANVTVVSGDAKERLKDIETPPDYVFIGGTKGRLSAILDEVYRKNEPAPSSSRPLPSRPWRLLRPITALVGTMTSISPRSVRPAVKKLVPATS